MNNTTAVKQAQKVYSSPEVLEFYDNFDSLYDKEERIVHDHYSNVKGKRVLDIGSGTGRIAAALAARDLKVTAFDFIPEMVARAQQKYPTLSFQVLDVRDMPYPANHFDHVWFSFNGLDCISPYTMRLKVLRDIYRLLKPGGLFVYSSHNAACVATTRVSRLKNIARNTLSLRIFSHYRHDYDVREGTSVLFYQNPRSQARTLRQVGFAKIQIYGNYPSDLRTFFSDAWPYYVARK